MSLPTYEQARREAEEMLGWVIVRGNAVTLHADTLRALLSGPPEQAEAVAWRWKFDEDGAWNYDDQHPGSFRFDSPDTAQPLYASPIPATEPTEEELTEVIWLRTECLNDMAADTARAVQALFRRHRNG